MPQFLQLFAKNLLKTLKHGTLHQKQTTIFQGFDQIFRKKLQKLWHCVKNHRNVSISLKLATFLCKLQCFRVLTKFLVKSCRLWHFVKKHQNFSITLKLATFFVQTTMFQGFDQTLSKKLQKLWHFVKNHQNVSISLKLATFLCKLPCFRVLSKYLAKSCKNYGIL